MPDWPYFLRYWSICVLQFFLTRLWRYKFWNLPCLSNQAVFLHDQKVKTKIWISWERKELLKWKKKHLSSLSVAKNCLRPESAPIRLRKLIIYTLIHKTWISNKTIMEVGNITKAATFKSFFHLSYKITQLLFFW